VREQCALLHVAAPRFARLLRRAAALALLLADGDADDVDLVDDDDDDDDDDDVVVNDVVDVDGGVAMVGDATDDAVARAADQKAVAPRGAPSLLVAVLHASQPRLATANALINALASLSRLTSTHIDRLRQPTAGVGRSSLANTLLLHARAAFRALLQLRAQWCGSLTMHYTRQSTDALRADRRAYERQAARCLSLFARLLPLLSVVH
jgi:hypothetical protein